MRVWPFLFAFAVSSAAHAEHDETAAQSVPALAPHAPLHVIYDGDAGHPSSHCSVGELSPLIEREPPAGVKLELYETSLGVLFENGRYVFAPERFSSPLLAADALESGSRSVEVLGDDVPMLVSDTSVTVQWPTKQMPPLTEHLHQNVLRQRRAGGAWQGSAKLVRGRVLRIADTKKGPVLVAEVPADAPGVRAADRSLDLRRKVSEYEFTAATIIRAHFAGRVGDVYQFCRMNGRENRRIPLMRKTIASTAPADRLVLAKGNTIGRYADQVLPIREKMGYDAMAAAAEDLERGVDWLVAAAKKHRLPYVAANLVHAKGENAGKPVFPRYRLIRRGERTIVVVGVVPERLQAVYSASLGDYRIEPPNESVHKALEDATVELGHRPDVTILLGNMSGNTLDAVLFGGFDLVLGPRRGYAPLGLEQGGKLPGDARPFYRSPLLVAETAPASVGHVRVDFRRDEQGNFVSAIAQRVLPVPATLAPDPVLREQVTARGMEIAREGADIVLPTPKEVVGGDRELETLAQAGPYSLTWSPELIRQLTAQLARESMDAEVGAVRRFGISVRSGGTMNAYLVSLMIDNPERLSTLALTGAQLTELNNLATGKHELVFAGFDPKGGTVDGRPLQPQQVYRVTLTDALVQDPAFDSVFHGRNGEPGERVSEVLVSGLRRLRDASGGLGASFNQGIKARLRPLGNGPRPLWIIGFEKVGLTYTLNRARNTDGFSAVREQRLSLPNYHFVEARGTLSVTYDHPSVTWRNALGFRFRRTYFGDLDDSVPLQQRETEDAIAPETELRFKSGSINLGDSRFQLVPFLRGRYETEFTALETGTRDGDDLVSLPRRKYLSGDAGLGVFPGGTVQELRLGGVVQKDFAKEEGRSLQVGVQTALKLARQVGPFRLSLDNNLTYFPRQGERDPIDRDVLGLRAQSTLTMAIPVGRWLNVGVTVDWLGFRGKVPTNDSLGQSLLVGLTLMVDRTWKPRFQGLSD